MSKFDEIYKKLIYESVATEVLEDTVIDAVLTNNQFYNNYMANLALKTGVIAVKARFDTFRIYGMAKNVVNFFKEFKVDNNYFMNDVNEIGNAYVGEAPIFEKKDKDEDFVLFNPMICVVDSSFFYHQMNDPGNEKYFTAGNYVPTREDLINLTHREALGSWSKIQIKGNDGLLYDMKEASPKDLAKVLSDLDKQSLCIIEFTINSKHLPNYVWEEDSFYWSGEEAVNSVLENQVSEGLQCKMPEVKDPSYKNKSLAEKIIDFNPTNKVSVKTLKMKK